MNTTDAMATRFTDFVTGLTYEAVPDEVKAIMRTSFVDTAGVAAIGSTTRMSEIARTCADRLWRGSPETGTARMLFDGRRVSPAGAAFAGAFTIDAIDAHDGFSPAKGHAGSAVFPAVLAIADALASTGQDLTGEELMVVLAIGYEVSYRAGLTLHGTVDDYHTSGAWTAVGIAAAAARMLGLDADEVLHATGIAEYHGPRSQMMRCIDHPTMLRDGVGWGAPTGVTAAYMAQMGFTGAPAITLQSNQAEPWWRDLGERWEVMKTHYKPYPVCRWAHPAIDAASQLMAEHGLVSADIERVRIQTFHNATRLAGHEPKTLDEMTYAIAFPVAAMIVRGKIGAAELEPAIFGDDEVLRIARATELVETEHYTRISTEKRWADVTLHLKRGDQVQSPPMTPRGDADNPMSADELAEKFRRFAEPVAGRARTGALGEMGARFDSLSEVDLARLCDLIMAPAGNGTSTP